ncbi:MAG: hypothetical protein LC799_18520 [Actinobacteria bacterium]|nr:hypothetical protein [Actinomycetota bacterium]
MSVHTVTVVIADLALLLAVPAYLTVLAAVVLLALRRSARPGTHPRRCPRHEAGTR